MRYNNDIINGIYSSQVAKGNLSNEEVIVKLLKLKKDHGATHVVFFTDNDINLFLYFKNGKINPYETRAIRDMELTKELQISIDKSIRNKTFGVYTPSINKIAILDYSL